MEMRVGAVARSIGARARFRSFLELATQEGRFRRRVGSAKGTADDGGAGMLGGGGGLCVGGVLRAAGGGCQCGSGAGDSHHCTPHAAWHAAND